MCAEKEYLEVKKDIKDLEEEYQRLLDKSDLTASEKYRKASFERKLTRIDELEKDKDFWMSRMKILQQKTLSPSRQSPENRELLWHSPGSKSYELDGIYMHCPFLDRPKLVEEVLECLDKYRMVLLRSPSGSGKTGLLDIIVRRK